MKLPIIKWMMLPVLSLIMMGGATSCKNYDSDIDELKDRIDAVNSTVKQLQTKLKQNYFITDVTALPGGGVSIKLDSGDTLVVGSEQSQSQAWKIGADGYWYLNGVKTDYRAVGEKGDKGDPGEPGAAGPSIYYVPNVDTHCWDIWEDGKFKEHTNISWLTSPEGAVTALYDGTALILSGIATGQVDASGNPVYTTVKIDNGSPVGSLEFIPSVVSKDVPYPTTDQPYLYISKYLLESRYNSGTRDFLPQTDINKSNYVTLGFRVNPSDAYVYELAQAEFINRGVVSRAAGDNTNLINVVTKDITTEGGTFKKYFDYKDSEIYVNTSFNKTRMIPGKNDIAALKLMNGQQNYTVSDYVAIQGQEIDAILVDSAAMKSNVSKVVSLFNRTKALPTAADETDAFIKQFVSLDDSATVSFVYTESLDLNPIPALFSTDMKNYLSNLGFDGISYKFSLPKEYKATDPQQTNQQWFVKLDENNILSVDPEHVNNGLTPAIGRTPVVRVDAYIKDNFGVERLVASAYIKVKIVRTPRVDQEDITYYLPAKEYEYHTLTSTPTLINQMFWQDVNNVIYGSAGLSSNSFWEYYGGPNDMYEVEITTTEKDGYSLRIGSGSAQADTPCTVSGWGIICETTLGNADTHTSNISFWVDNHVLTQNSLKDFDGKGAKFEVKITIKADEPDKSDAQEKKGNVVVIQEFYVKDECRGYNFNPNYYAGEVDGHQDVVITKGKLVDGVWKLEMNISEVFEMRNGQNIFSYYKTFIPNVTGIVFSLDPTTQDGVKLEKNEDESNALIELTAPLKGKSLFVGMKYDETLVNKETCTFRFNIEFLNPFVGTTGQQVNLNGNATGAVTVDTKPSVRVNDVDNQPIYLWSNGDLRLSNVALNTYKVAEPTINFEFDKEDIAYQTFKGNLDPKATFDIDKNTGVVTYDNLGATLIPSYNLKVKATVKFGNISVVECIIPLHIQGKN